MTPGERKAFADTAEEAIYHPLVAEIIAEYRQNMRALGTPVEPGTPANYGLLKCLNGAVQVARAQALGIDPRDLLMSAEEVAEHEPRRARLAHDAGKPVFLVEGRPRGQEDGDDDPA